MSKSDSPEVTKLAARLGALDPKDDEANSAQLKDLGFTGFGSTKAEEKEVKADGTEELKVAEPGPSDASKLLESLSHEVEIKLADQQADPNSPLYSAKSFEDLNLSEELKKGLYTMGFQKPSKIQERALPLLLGNPPRNMIGQSQSGTGKTAAFVLTMLTRIDPNIQAPQAICVAPSRELARQILDVAEDMSKYLNITKVLASAGTLPRGERVTAQVVVGTPGTLKDALTKFYVAGTREPVLSAREIRVLVADEADVMIGTGSLSEQTLHVKNTIAKSRKEFQIVLFSATFPDAVRNYAARFAPNANSIQLRKEELTVEGIKQFYLDCDSEEHRYDVLAELYHILTIGQSIIFAQHRATADKIAERMNREGHKVVSLHGAQDGEGRDRTIDEFRAGKHKVLITTNVVARGIDISQVNMVINYDLPMLPGGKIDSETYLHRIGRTGRFGRKGISINFVSSYDAFQHMMQIKQELHMKDEQLMAVSTKDFDVMEKTLKAALKA